MFGEIRNLQGERIDYTFHEGQPGTRNLVVLGHGVTGNKDRPFLVNLGTGLSAAGIPVLRFSFTGNGASEGRFIDSNITKEVADLGAILEKLGNHRVAYAGHSMGGAVGVLRASEDPRIALLISLAGMVHTAAFAQREFGMIKPDEGCMWDDPGCPLSKAFMDDLTRIGSVVDRAGSIKVPWLLIHGIEDDVVPIQDSRDMFVQAKEPKEFMELKGANHVFAGEACEPMVRTVVGWLKRQLG